MRRRGGQTLAGHLRRQGVRVSAGPWTICANSAPGRGRLILALGRASGGAVTRSRVRRIAREVLAGRCERPEAADLLLLARSDVSRHPRRQVRGSLAELLNRLSAALARHAGQGQRHA